MTEPSKGPPDNEAPDAQLWQRWRQGERIDVGEFLAGFADLEAAEVVAVLLVDQRERWQVGERIPAESYLRRFPLLEATPEAVVELAYGEFLLREERGERPALEEYLSRFPGHEVRLRQQVQLHRALLGNTTAPNSLASQITLVQTPAVSSSAATPPDYEILEELGRGGMGVVYKARQVKANRVVALKMILAGGHAGASEMDRFRTEAEAIARLQHPNIVQIFEVGEHDGLPFFSLEFCPGGNLDRKLGGRPLAAQLAAALVERLALAMQAAHQKGIIHRDLKPANVLLAEDGAPKISDFGLARKLDEAGQTQTGALLGTPSYMAPEQAQGKTHEIGPLADAYALGAILYECLTGRPPFRAATYTDTVVQVVEQEPAPPRQLNGATPRDLETICLKCLEKEPAKRYGGAEALADDLRRWQAGEPITARPVGRLERGLRWGRRNPVVLTLGGLLLLVLAGTAVGGVIVSLSLKQALGQARQDRDKAHEAEARAQAEAVRSRRTSYDADMQLAAQLWESPTGSARAVLDLLEAHRPQPGQEDLREFAWRYQRWLSHAPLTLPNHRGTPFVALAADGRLVTFDEDRVLRRWDRATRSVLSSWRLSNEADVKYCFDLSPDGAVLAVGTSAGKVSLYDAANGQERPFVKGGAAVSHLSFGPDSSTLAIVHGDDKARVRQVRDGKLLATMALPGSSYEYCALGRRGEALVLVGEPDNSQALVYRIGKSDPVVCELTSSLGAVACSGDGTRVAAGDSIQINLWEAATGKLVAKLPTLAGGVYALAFSPDGARLGMGGLEGLVTVWDLSTQQRLFQLKGHTGRVTKLRFAPDGKTLVSAASDGTAKLWEFDALDEFRSLVPAEGSPATWLSYSPDGRWLAVAGKPSQLWDARTMQPVRRLSPAVRLAFSPDGKTLALGDWDGRVHLCEAASGRIVRSFEGRPGEPVDSRKAVGSLAFSPDGKLLAAGLGSAHWWADDYEQFAKVWDVATGQEVTTLAHNNTVPALAFSLNGSLLATASRQGPVRLWTVGRWQEFRTLKGEKSSDAVAFAPGGDLLATGDSDYAIRLWDVETGELRRALRGHSYGVFGLAFSPDGKTLASASWDRTIKLWDPVSGRELRTLKGHPNWAHCVAFTPDGGALASCDQSGGVRLWDSVSHQQKTESGKAHPSGQEVKAAPK